MWDKYSVVQSLQGTIRVHHRAESSYMTLSHKTISEKKNAMKCHDAVPSIDMCMKRKKSQ